MGRVPYSGHSYRVRGYASGPRAAAPTLGEHSFEVLHELLGVEEDGFESLARRGITGEGPPPED